MRRDWFTEQGPDGVQGAAFSRLCKRSVCHFGDKQPCVFNFEGETFNFKMSAGNRDIGKRTRVLCVTCTSNRRRSCASARPEECRL